ncbi:MAG: hypothetical protein MI867_20360, partial [Pseudomonadales bacterium]|nr:hypothetical protein [Pseudomonadales bacterium]
SIEENIKARTEEYYEAAVADIKSRVGELWEEHKGIFLEYAREIAKTQIRIFNEGDTYSNRYALDNWLVASEARAAQLTYEVEKTIKKHIIATLEFMGKMAMSSLKMYMDSKASDFSL